MTATCPSDDELVRLVEGALGDASLAALERHVDGCERCAAVLGDLGAVARPAGAPRRRAHYQLDRRIAAGGMGEVWAAWDPELKREVAIKRIRPEWADEPRERARLVRDASRNAAHWQCSHVSSCSMSGSVRKSCHVMALTTGCPGRASQMKSVPRCEAMPIAATSDGAQ